MLVINKGVVKGKGKTWGPNDYFFIDWHQGAVPNIDNINEANAKRLQTSKWCAFSRNAIITAEDGFQIEQKLKELNYFKPFE